MKPKLNKEEIEGRVEAIITRIAAGVIAYNQDLVLIKLFSGASLTKYNIGCNPADQARLIGKGGGRIRSLRTIMALAGAKLGREMQLASVAESGVRKSEPFEKFQYNPKWPKAEVTKLLEDTCEAIFIGGAKVFMREISDRSIVYTVLTQETEQFDVVAAMPAILNDLFNGIGVTHGCQISIDVGRQ